MGKKAMWGWIIVLSMFLFSSCGFLGTGGRLKMLMSEDRKADLRAEEIVSAVQQKDSEALKAMFSARALEEADALDGEIAAMFEFLEGELVSWEKDGCASDQSIRSGKRTLLMRYEIFFYTDQDGYSLYVFDYNTDTINPENEGLYKIEVSRLSYHGEWEAWQDRMRAGIEIIE